MNEHIHRYRWYQTERLKGLCLSQVGREAEAVVCLENAARGFKELLEKVTDPVWIPHITHDLGMVLFDLCVFHYENSNMLAAQSYVHESIAVWRRVRTNFLELAKLLNTVGFFHYQCGEYQEAWLAFQEAVEYYKLLETDSNYIYLLVSIGDLQRDLAEWEAAENTFRTATTLGKTLDDEIHSMSAYLGLSHLDMIRGKYDTAMQFLRDAARAGKHAMESPWFQGKWGEILLEMGQFELAIESFQKALKAWEGTRSPNQEQILTTFGLGKACFAIGETDQALNCLENCLKGTARLGYDQFLVVVGRRAESFLQYAAQMWPENLQLRWLRERIKSFQTGIAQFQNQVLTAEPPETRLEVFAFGKGKIRRNGVLIPKSVWQASNARALIFYLIERGRVQNNEIKLDFWPEFITNKATTNLQSTLWRARNALGGKDSVSVQGTEYSLAPHIHLWYDIAEFREYLKRAAKVDISPFERAELWRRAIELYRGDYLDDMLLDWTDASRTELLALYVETLINLAEWEAERGRFAAARNLFDTAIRKEPYRDDIRLALMKCLVRLGAPSAAEAHFLEYKQFLAESGLEPSTELVEYYEKFIKPP